MTVTVERGSEGAGGLMWRRDRVLVNGRLVADALSPIEASSLANRLAGALGRIAEFAEAP